MHEILVPLRLEGFIVWSNMWTWLRDVYTQNGFIPSNNAILVNIATKGKHKYSAQNECKQKVQNHLERCLGKCITKEVQLFLSL